MSSQAPLKPKPKPPPIEAPSGTAGTAHDRTAFYVTPGLDENLSLTTASGSTYYYSQDGLGSVRTLTTSNGSLTNTYDYTPFGAPIAQRKEGEIHQRYTYTGRTIQKQSSKYFYRNRSGYDPERALFSNRNPWGYVQGRMSLYEAMLQNPTGHREPYSFVWLSDRIVPLLPGQKYLRWFAKDVFMPANDIAMGFPIPFYEQTFIPYIQTGLGTYFGMEDHIHENGALAVHHGTKFFNWRFPGYTFHAQQHFLDRGDKYARNFLKMLPLSACCRYKGELEVPNNFVWPKDVHARNAGQVWGVPSSWLPWQEEPTHSNETKYGDTAQWAAYANLGLGSFSYRLERQIRIVYYSDPYEWPECVINYEIHATMIVTDGLGADFTDPSWYQPLRYIFPVTTVRPLVEQ